jgi:hypothetical protein
MGVDKGEVGVEVDIRYFLLSLKLARLIYADPDVQVRACCRMKRSRMNNEIHSLVDFGSARTLQLTTQVNQVASY